MFLHCVWQLVRMCPLCTYISSHVWACVCACASVGEERLLLKDCITGFIPARAAGIICNWTTAGCQKATNKPYGYVWLTALRMLWVVIFFYRLSQITCRCFAVSPPPLHKQPNMLKPTLAPWETGKEKPTKKLCLITIFSQFYMIYSGMRNNEMVVVWGWGGGVRWGGFRPPAHF